jgi:hypothetical protein
MFKDSRGFGGMVLRIARQGIHPLSVNPLRGTGEKRHTFFY